MKHLTHAHSRQAGSRTTPQVILDRCHIVAEAHWDGINAWQQNRLRIGLLEGTNSLVQAAKRGARGYRSKQKMITNTYLIAGKLPLPEVHTI